MKCTQCGQSFSSTRTQCPGCGAPIERAPGRVRLAPIASQTAHNSGPAAEAAVSLPQEQDSALASSLHTPTNSESEMLDAHAHTPVMARPTIEPSSPMPSVNTGDLAAEVVQPAAAAPIFPPYTNVPQTPRTEQADYWPAPQDAGVTKPNQRYMYPQLQPSTRAPRTRLGFTIAGSFMGTGALLLVIVFIMMQTLLTSVPASTTITHQNTPASATKTSQHKPQPTAAMPTATPIATAQQYIDNIQLASKINTATGTPEISGSTFHVGQPVYVTFTLHQQAYSGTVCLTWVLNKQSTPYSTQIDNSNSSLTQISAYFYFKPAAAGQGSVIVTWSSMPDCSNTIPAQRANFVVIA